MTNFLIFTLSDNVMFSFVRYAVALAQVTWNTPLTFMKYGHATV